MNKLRVRDVFQNKIPWALSFSYGRALQHSARITWLGKDENIEAAQTALHHRAKLNSCAALGRTIEGAEGAEGAEAATAGASLAEVGYKY